MKLTIPDLKRNTLMICICPKKPHSIFGYPQFRTCKFRFSNKSAVWFEWTCKISLLHAEDEDKEIMDRPMMEYHAGNIAEGRYVIRSCFGGVKSAFVASGSEV